MSAERASPALLSAMRNWWGERVSRIGARKAASEFVAEIWEFLRDSAPARRRQRYGDMDYDWEYRVDTTSATVSWRDRLLGVFHSPYQPTEPALFHEMIEGLGIEYARFTFVDLGSGKGRTLLMASEYPFRRVVGVELLPELHRVAEDNLGRFSSEKRKCATVETICGDATTFVFPMEPLVLYLFNPLPEAGLERVLENLEKSLAEAPRQIWLIYHNPLLEHTVARCPALRRAGGTLQYSVYASETMRSTVVSN
jgi:SAM-dependent methyltransferase